MRTWKLCVAVAMLLIMMVSVALAATPSIEGTYKLKSRKLADGTMVGEKDLQGVFSLAHGLRNFNVGWMDPSGKHFSYSVISTYKMTDTDFTETVLLSVMNDEIGMMPGSKPGSGPVYVMNESKTVPIKVEGTKITMKTPFDIPTLTFDGDTLTGTLEGVFVDTWVKLK